MIKSLEKTIEEAKAQEKKAKLIEAGITSVEAERLTAVDAPEPTKRRAEALLARHEERLKDEERQAKEDAERQAREDAERQAKEEAERQESEEAERKSREEAEANAEWAKNIDEYKELLLESGMNEFDATNRTLPDLLPNEREHTLLLIKGIKQAKAIKEREQAFLRKAQNTKLNE